MDGFDPDSRVGLKDNHARVGQYLEGRRDPLFESVIKEVLVHQP